IVSKTPDEALLIRTAREVNDAKPHWVLHKVRDAISLYLEDNPGKKAADVTIACYGLTFKPDIDDLRESPAVEIVRALIESHPGPVLVVEPNVSAVPAALSEATLVRSGEPIRAEIHVLLVDHAEFRGVDAPEGQVIDTRNAWRR